MILQQGLTPANITAIGTNAAGVVVTGNSIPARGFHSYKVINLTGVPLFLVDDSGQAIDIIAGLTFSADVLETDTMFLQLVYNPANGTNTPGVAYTTNPSWQAWIGLYKRRRESEPGQSGV